MTQGIRVGQGIFTLQPRKSLLILAMNVSVNYVLRAVKIAPKSFKVIFLKRLKTFCATL